MFVYFYDKIIGMKQIFKKRLVIKTQFDPDNPNLSDEAKKYMELKQSQFQAKEYLESYDIK